ncbi:MAG: DUF433 domain-containing protein [Pseudolysinimonas sp.]|uniref:DUF433 domain-containing protein n=1 Tax=Pseudolysinimonas sp. TaxID=2680009 RepID=UPI003C796A29
MERDWADDETLTAKETIRRFESLNPEPTRGPRAGQYIFAKVGPHGVLPRIDRITVDLEVMNGRPTVRGMRIRATDVLSLLAAGATHADILAEYPYLEEEDIIACLEYAAAIS